MTVQNLPAPTPLRRLRLARGLTLDAVAVLAGVDPATVSRMERGLDEPRPETIVRLARGLGIGARRMREIIRQSAEVELP